MKAASFRQTALNNAIRRFGVGAAIVAVLGAAGCVYAPPVYDGELVIQEPPPLRAEIVGVAPFPGAIWITGYWGWTNTRHHWVPGHWVEPRPRHRWVPHRWDRVPGGWRRNRGHWKRR